MDRVVKLKPYIKSAIWGGQYFKDYFQTDLDNIAEVWALAHRMDNSSYIDSGFNKGEIIYKVVGQDDLGDRGRVFPYFPLLIKLIDAKDNLSVQVHPDDEYALKHERSFGKTEMWHIISADEGSGIYVGLNRDYTKKEIKDKLKDGTIIDVLNFYKVKPGETYLIKSGTIHAIGKGVRLIEIQQNSDLTYRLYDYNRKDSNGKCRKLHIKQALDVIDYHKYVLEEQSNEYLAKTPYFRVKRVEFDEELEIKADDQSFLSFTFLSGYGYVDDIPFKQYDTFFLSNNLSCKIKGKGVVIISGV